MLRLPVTYSYCIILLHLQCPVFLLFLDCVSQLRKMFPGSFQFSAIYLVHVWDALNSGMFGTFAFNSPHDRIFSTTPTSESVTGMTASHLPYLLPSAWDWPQQFADSQLSLMYDPLYTTSCDLDSAVTAVINGRKPQQRRIAITGDSFRLPTMLANVHPWSLCYLRWLSPVMIIGGGPACEYLTQCLLVEEIGQLRQQITELEQASGGGRDKCRRSVLIFGAGGVTADLVGDVPASAGRTQRVSSSFPFVPRHSADETPSALSQVPSVDTYLESSLLSTDLSSLAVFDDSASASFCDDGDAADVSSTDDG